MSSSRELDTMAKMDWRRAARRLPSQSIDDDQHDAVEKLWPAALRTINDGKMAIPLGDGNMAALTSASSPARLPLCAYGFPRSILQRSARCRRLPSQSIDDDQHDAAAKWLRE